MDTSNMRDLKAFLSELLITLIVTLLAQGLLTPPPPLTLSLPLTVIQVMR
jgi:hypothetical protein